MQHPMKNNNKRIGSKQMPSAETGTWIRITHTLRQCSWCGAVSLGGENAVRAKHACGSRKKDRKEKI